VCDLGLIKHCFVGLTFDHGAPAEAGAFFMD